MESVRWIDQRAVDAHVEAAVAAEEVLLAIAHYEVAVALDGHVGELARRLQRALSLDRVDATDQHTQTNLLGVDATATALRATCAANRLTQNVLEGDTRLLEAGSVDVGDVIADHVHESLMVLQTGNGGEHGAHHVGGSPWIVRTRRCRSWGWRMEWTRRAR